MPATRSAASSRRFYTMIEDHLAVPFATQVLGVEVSVVGVEMDDNGSLKAMCERNGKRQLIGLIDLQLPKPPPSGAEWTLDAADPHLADAIPLGGLIGIATPSSSTATTRSGRPV